MQCLTLACEPMIGIFCRQLAEFFWEQRVFFFVSNTQPGLSNPPPLAPAGELRIPAQTQATKKHNQPAFFLLHKAFCPRFLSVDCISKMPTVPSLTPTRECECVVDVRASFFIFRG